MSEINLPKNNLLSIFVHPDGTVFKTEVVVKDFTSLDDEAVIEKLINEYRALLNAIKKYELSART